MNLSVTNELASAVARYAREHANADGLALTPVPGLRMMRVLAPSGPMQSTYRPLVCMVLQGAKQMVVGTNHVLIQKGQSILVSADMPVRGRIVEASRARPYLAVAIELDLAILRDIADQLPAVKLARDDTRTSFVEPSQQPQLECALRLMNLLEKPTATKILHPAIMRELHYWLLTGAHGPALLALTAKDARTARLTAAIRLLRAEFRERLAVDRLASEAAMSLTSFHLHFRKLTSLTPIQYQKRLRLIEARDLIQRQGWLVSRAAFEVGYESVSQFTREYGRLFGAPPKQDALRRRRMAGHKHESRAL